MCCSKKLLLGLTLLGLSLTAAHAAPLRVLYFTKSSGWEHSVVKNVDGAPSHSERILTSLAARNDLAFTYSKDGSLFSPEYLAAFDVVVFYTSGDLFSVGTDGHPAMTPAGKQALLDAVAGGKGFVAVHSGGDSFHTLESGGGNPTARHNRYIVHGDTADAYIKMLGGEFINHGAQQVARARVVDPHFPGCGEIGDTYECLEEWYSMKEFAPNLHALLVLDTAGMQGPDYARPPFPLAWARTFGKGRVWFNGMGHREDVWEDARFQSLLIGGIKWAGGRVDADVTPNLDKVAPQAAAMPPERTGT